MYSQTLNAKQLSLYRAQGLDYDITYIENEQELNQIETPFTIIGNGTNSLWIHPQKGPIVCLHHLNHLEFSSNNCVTVEAGVLLPTLIREAKKKNLGGLEFTWPIATSLSGAIAQNFGAYGKEISSFIRRLTIFDPKTKALSNHDQLAEWFSYRSSKIKRDKLLIVSAVLELAPCPEVEIDKELARIHKERSSRYPLHHTCGSVFKNPTGFSAGKLIDDCGLKGHTMGKAFISPNHGNVITTHPGATTQEIYDLILFVQEAVATKTGVQLEPELAIY